MAVDHQWAVRSQVELTVLPAQAAAAEQVLAVGEVIGKAILTLR